jgi:glycosyltransferase involved in cell wall biosynthesis
MLVGERRNTDADIRLLKRHVGWRAADRACSAVCDRLDLQYVLCPSSFGIALDAWFREADVVQLYNTHGSYFSHSALPLLSRRKPLVWRLSDMWAFTGHTAYSYECERWKTGCGSCPHLDVYPRLNHDRTALLWRWKQTVYSRSRIVVVAPSRWLLGLARESPLLGRFPMHLIPNGVELDVYTPRPRDEARRALGLDPDRKTLLFATPDLDDPRKGSSLLPRILAGVGTDVQLVAAGAGPAPEGARSLGRLDAERLALAYAAADVFVLPTLAENLPNTALESIACGTPVAAFAVGGVVDAVRDGETGRLAPLGDAEALGAAVAGLLDADLRGSCRAIAEREFAAEHEVRAFASLYEDLVAAR